MQHIHTQLTKALNFANTQRVRSSNRVKCLGVDTRILNDSTRISRHVCHTLVYTWANHIKEFDLLVHHHSCTLRLVEWLDLQGTIRKNPQTKTKYTKCSLIFEPVVNEVKKLRSSVHFTGAIYQAPVHNVCGGCLAAEFPTVDGGGLEVTVAALPNGCCQSCPNCTVSQVTTILHEQFYIQNMLGAMHFCL